MRKIYGQITLIVALAGVAGQAWADTVTIGASKDNSIFQSNANNSAGGAAGIFVGTTGFNNGGSIRRGLIAFDVAANVPAGATITGAQLTLYLGLAGGGADESVELHRLNVDWGEGTAGSSNPTILHGGRGSAASAGDATWSSRFLGSSLWSNPGATGDFNATASASTVIPYSPETPFTWSSPAMVADIQNWMDNSAANFGWALINADEVNLATVRAFYSRSATVNGGGDPLEFPAQPVLSITYVVPEPSASVLMAWTCVLLFSRRRR